MKCPHCLTSFHEQASQNYLGEDRTSHWTLVIRTCPACSRFVISLREKYDRYNVIGANHYHNAREFLCYPKTVSPPPCRRRCPVPIRTTTKRPVLPSSTARKLVQR